MKFNFSKYKKVLFIGSIALVLIASILIYFKFRQQLSGVLLGPKQRLSSLIKMKTFQGANPPFDFIFEYPAAWKASEIKQPSLNMAQVQGPQDKVTRIIPGVFITVREVTVRMTSSQIAEALIHQEKRLRGFKEIVRKDEQVGGVKALKLVYQYILPLPLNSTNAKDAIVRRQEIYLLRNGKEYRISFWMTEEQYKLYKPVFDHMPETFKFLD